MPIYIRFGGGTWILFGLQPNNSVGVASIYSKQVLNRYSVPAPSELRSHPSTDYRNKNKAHSLISIAMVGVLGLEPRTLRV